MLMITDAPSAEFEIAADLPIEVHTQKSGKSKY